MSRQQLMASVALASPKPHPREIFEKMNLPEFLRPSFNFLSHAHTREEFFDTIMGMHICTAAELDLICKAYDVAEREFRKVYRKSGERYFEHLRRCTLILVLYVGVRDVNMVVAMLLHDLIEMRRRSWTHARIAAVFNEEVALLVSALSKFGRSHALRTKAAVNHEYFGWLAKAPYRVIVLKAVDRLDNLLTLWAKSNRKIKHTLGETEHYILPLLRTHGVLVYETITVLRYIRNRIPH